MDILQTHPWKVTGTFRDVRVSKEKSCFLTGLSTDYFLEMDFEKKTFLTLQNKSNSNCTTTGIPSHEHLTLKCLRVKIMINHYSSKYEKIWKRYSAVVFSSSSVFLLCFLGILGLLENVPMTGPERAWESCGMTSVQRKCRASGFCPWASEVSCF